MLELAALAGLVVVLWSMVRGPTRKMDDRVDLIPAADEREYNRYLGWVEDESGIDIRIVLVPDTDGMPVEQFALATMRQLEVGKDNGGRGLLVLYDSTARTIRFEVGPRLEGILPDAFLGYLVRQHLDPFFGAERPELGLRTTMFMLHWRIRRARLGEEYDPAYEEYARQARQIAVGGGASGKVAGEGSARLVGLTPDSAWRKTFGPQPGVEAAHQRLQEWLALGCRDIKVPLFTPESRTYLSTLPLSPALCAYLLAFDYGRQFQVDERGDLALLYFTDDPFVSPHFFRRTSEGWQVDLRAEVNNTQEAIGIGYTWRLIVSGDDFSRVFADRYTQVPLAGIGEFYRVAGGDNRMLSTRGDAAPVESEPTLAVTPVSRSLTDGAPGVEYLTVRQAAERIEAAKGQPTIVLLYDVWSEERMSRFPEMVKTARNAGDLGMAFLAFNTDLQPRNIERLPGLLSEHGATFSAVHLYPWRSGLLDGTFKPLGIEVGSTWTPPLVAVLDREGQVVWQAQGVTDWDGVQAIATRLAPTQEETPR